MKKMVGESGMHATFYYLELVEVLHRPVEFHKRLQSMFKEGSEIIEKAILRELYGRLNWSSRSKEGLDSQTMWILLVLPSWLTT